MHFQKYRNKERANERFIPFLIIKYNELKSIKTIKELNLLLNFAIVNAFVNYEDYQEFTKKIYLLTFWTHHGESPPQNNGVLYR